MTPAQTLDPGKVVHTRTYTHIKLLMYMHIYIYIYINLYMHITMYIRVYIYIYIYMYIDVMFCMYGIICSMQRNCFPCFHCTLLAKTERLVKPLHRCWTNCVSLSQLDSESS